MVSVTETMYAEQVVRDQHAYRSRAGVTAAAALSKFDLRATDGEQFAAGMHAMSEHVGALLRDAAADAARASRSKRIGQRRRAVDAVANAVRRVATQVAHDAVDFATTANEAAASTPAWLIDTPPTPRSRDASIRVYCGDAPFSVRAVLSLAPPALILHI